MVKYDDLLPDQKIRVLFDGVEKQNDGTYTDMTKQAFANNEILQNPLSGYYPRPIGTDAFGWLYEVKQSSEPGQLKTLDEDGNPSEVSQGFGIGVRQHDDVMLSWGHSKTTVLNDITIPSGEFLILRLNTGAFLNYHHTENRSITTQGASVKVQLYEVDPSEVNLFPTNPQQLKVVNENGPLVEDGAGFAEFFSYAVQASNPFAGLPEARTYLPIFVRVQENTGPATRDISNGFASIKGRHYTANKIYALVIQNVGTQNTIFDYLYSYHEK